MNLRDIFLAGAFAQVVGGAVSPEQITEAVNNYLDKNPVGVDLAMTGAAVGQIAKITAVDASGVPTAWEPVDMPSGGGGGDVWELMATVDMVQDATYAQVDLPHPVKKLFVYTSRSGTATAQSGTIRLSLNSAGHNNATFAEMIYADKYRPSYSLVDFTVCPEPLSINGDNQSAKTQLFEVYNGSMTISTFYITTKDNAGLFNSGTWYVYGVKA